MSPRPTTSRRLPSSPTRSSWTRRRSSPTKSLLRTPTTMTLHSRMCFTKHTEHMPITLHGKTCLSVCRRRQCPIERSDPLEIDRGDPLSTENQKHRLGLKQLEPKKFNNEINNFFKDSNYSKISNYVKLIKEVSLKWKS